MRDSCPDQGGTSRCDSCHDQRSDVIVVMTRALKCNSCHDRGSFIFSRPELRITILVAMRGGAASAVLVTIRGPSFCDYCHDQGFEVRFLSRSGALRRSLCDNCHDQGFEVRFLSRSGGFEVRFLSRSGVLHRAMIVTMRCGFEVRFLSRSGVGVASIFVTTRASKCDSRHDRSFECDVRVLCRCDSTRVGSPDRPTPGLLLELATSFRVWDPWGWSTFNKQCDMSCVLCCRPSASAYTCKCLGAVLRACLGKHVLLARVGVIG